MLTPGAPDPAGREDRQPEGAARLCPARPSLIQDSKVPGFEGEAKAVTWGAGGRISVRRGGGHLGRRNTPWGTEQGGWRLTVDKKERDKVGERTGVRRGLVTPGALRSVLRVRTGREVLSQLGTRLPQCPETSASLEKGAESVPREGQAEPTVLHPGQKGWHTASDGGGEGGNVGKLGV